MCVCLCVFICRIEPCEVAASHSFVHISYVLDALKGCSVKNIHGTSARFVLAGGVIRRYYFQVLALNTTKVRG